MTLFIVVKVLSVQEPKATPLKVRACTSCRGKPKMAAIVKQGTTVARAGDVEVGQVQRDKITIKTTGNPTSIPGNMYGDANFYIQQSRKYFPERKFTTYVYFFYMYIVYLLVFLGSLAAPANFIYAFVMTGVNGLFLLFYIQHLYVIAKTMRYVLRQHSVPNNSLNWNNDHIEISIEVYRAQYATTSNVAVGVVAKGSGTIKIQLFKHKTMAVMKNTVVVSIFSFIGSVLMVLYCPAVGFWKLAIHVMDNNSY